MSEIKQSVDYEYNKKRAPNKFYESNLIADDDWHWWSDLPDHLKYILIYNLEDVFKEEVHENVPEWWICDDELESEVELNDRAIMGNFVAKYITGYYDKDGNLDYSRTLVGMHVPDKPHLDDFDKFSRLKFLEEISFYKNTLCEVLPGLGKFTQIKRLQLNYASLGEGGVEENEYNFAELSTLINLEELDLSNNLLSGTVKSYEPLTKLTNLKTLNLGCNWIDSKAVGILDKIAQLTHLQRLDLFVNELDEHDFSPLSNLHELKTLNLSYSVTITDDLLKVLSSLSNLEHLYLRAHKAVLKGNGLDLSNLTSLKELTVSLVNAKLLSAVVTIPNLERLTLEFADSKAAEGAEFSKLTHLKWL